MIKFQGLSQTHYWLQGTWIQRTGDPLLIKEKKNTSTNPTTFIITQFIFTLYKENPPVVNYCAQKRKSGTLHDTNEI